MKDSEIARSILDIMYSKIDGYPSERLSSEAREWLLKKAYPVEEDTGPNFGL